MLSIARKTYHQLEIHEAKETATGTRYTASNDMVVLCSVSGAGKTLALENVVHNYWKKGFTVINLTDVKLNFENCFACLPINVIPDFHKFKIEKQNELDKMEQVPMKIYHPFTFNLPSRKLLPDINIFTIPLKSLRREHFSFLSETHASSETVKLLLSTTESLKSTDGIYAYFRLVNSMIEEKQAFFKGKKIKNSSSGFFTSASTSGTMKDIKNIHSLLKPFNTDYFLSSEMNPLNIDFVKIINDQSHYHCLTYKWLKDEKMQYFTILSFLMGIDKALDHAKYPVVLVIDEIRKLVPNKPTGYKEYLGEIIKNMLIICRNKGLGGTSIVCGSQQFFDIEEDIRNSFTEIMLGRLPPQDIERLAKIHGWNQSMRHKMTSMKKNHFHRLGDTEVDEYTFKFPLHAHKEPYHNFFNLYHKYFPFLEKKYGDLIKKQKKLLDKEIEDDKILAKKKLRKLKEDMQKAEEDKLSNSKVVQEAQAIKEKAKIEKLTNKEELMKRCYEIFTDPTLPEPPSFREVGKQTGVSFITAKKYIKLYSDKLKEKEALPKLD